MAKNLGMANGDDGTVAATPASIATTAGDVAGKGLGWVLDQLAAFGSRVALAMPWWVWLIVAGVVVAAGLYALVLLRASGIA